MFRLSVVIIAYNEGHQLGRCLERVKEFADEILVGDTGSTDDTASVAITYGAKVISLEWKGFAKTKNELNTHASGDFILSLDADEVLDDILQEALIKLKPMLDPNAAYSINRLAFIGNHPIYFGGWYPDRKVRLFSKQKAYWTGDFVHEKLKLDNGIKIIQLPGRILHYSFQNLHDLVERSNRYSTLGAEALWAQNVDIPFWKKWLAPFWRFIQSYVVKQGFRDGFWGLFLATALAWEAWLKYSKVQEKRLNQASKNA